MTAMIDTCVHSLWAKTGASPSGEPTEHPLVCHLIDVAEVARTLWNRALPASARRRFAVQFELDEEQAGRWVALLAGLHDLGKASPAFQMQEERVRPRLAAAGFPLPRHFTPTPHGTITAAVLSKLLVADLGVPAAVSLRAATAVGGHHGLFPGRLASVDPVALGAGLWDEVRAALVHWMVRLMGVERNSGPRALELVTAVMLGGLVSVADWIASNTNYFPHEWVSGKDAAPLDPERYRERAATYAARALEGLGWVAWAPPVVERSFEQCFPGLSPRPLQAAASTLRARLTAPGLIVIEAPMGEGKTEAALFLIERWNACLGQHGFYVAMPTQATSDQMFARLRGFLGRERPGELVAMQLLHGHASLSAEFETLLREGDRALRLQGVHDDDDPVGEGTVVAAEWFTFRKRGLLAQYGVGTIDQALLAVLQARHVFVRQFGLAHKAIVFDEVHAYDTYMTTLLERLLAWLAALQAPVVLLSATLPSARRERLMAAYCKGLGVEEREVSEPEAPYPRISWVTAKTSGVLHAPASAAQRRTVRLEWVELEAPDRRQALACLAARLRATVAQGGCVGVICNTVARAQEAYRALASEFPGTADDGEPRVDLLHARFPFEEREARQARVLRRFGPPVIAPGTRQGPETSGFGRPSQAVLVATQVVEQSLDLDFDLLISDVAPVDLVLQRLGRLHRHQRQRPALLSWPALWLARVPVAADGCPQFDAAAEAVYDRHVLLRSWLALSGRARIELPEDIDPLVQEVYGERAGPPAGLSQPLRVLWNETYAEQNAARQDAEREAQVRWIKPPWSEVPLAMFLPSPGEEDAPEVHPAHQALTRLAEPSAAVVLLYASPHGPARDPDGREPVDLSRPPANQEGANLLRRSVTLTDRRLVHVLRQVSVPPAWRRSPLLRHHRPLVLAADGTARFGRHTLRLDRDLGVIIETEAS